MKNLRKLNMFKMKMMMKFQMMSRYMILEMHCKN